MLFLFDKRTPYPYRGFLDCIETATFNKNYAINVPKIVKYDYKCKYTGSRFKGLPAFGGAVGDQGSRLESDEDLIPRGGKDIVAW